MKKSIFPLLLVLCLTLSACGVSGGEAPSSQEGDTLTLGDKTYLFRRAELYYYRNQPVYQWGLCVEKGVNDTWASQS